MAFRNNIVLNIYNTQKRYNSSIQSSSKKYTLSVALLIFNNVKLLNQVFLFKIRDRLKKKSISAEEIYDILIKDINISNFKKDNLKLKSYLLTLISGLETYYNKQYPTKYYDYDFFKNSRDIESIYQGYDLKFKIVEFNKLEYDYRYNIKNTLSNLFQDKNYLKKILSEAEYRNFILSNICQSTEYPENIGSMLFRNLLLNLAEEKYYLSRNDLYDILEDIFLGKIDNFLLGDYVLKNSDGISKKIDNFSILLKDKSFQKNLSSVKTKKIGDNITLKFFTTNRINQKSFVSSCFDYIIKSYINLNSNTENLSPEEKLSIIYDRDRLIAFSFFYNFHFLEINDNDIKLNFSESVDNLIKEDLKNKLLKVYKSNFYKEIIPDHKILAFGNYIYKILFNGILFNISYSYNPENRKKYPILDFSADVEKFVGFSNNIENNFKEIHSNKIIDIESLSKNLPIWNKAFLNERINLIPSEICSKSQSSNKLILKKIVNNEFVGATNILTEMFRFPAININEQFIKFLLFQRGASGMIYYDVSLYDLIPKDYINNLSKAAYDFEIQGVSLLEDYINKINSPEIKSFLEEIELDLKNLKIKYNNNFNELEYNKQYKKIIKRKKNNKQLSTINNLYVKYLDIKNKLLSEKTKFININKELFQLLLFACYHNTFNKSMNIGGIIYSSCYELDWRARRYLTTSTISVTSSKVSRLLVGYNNSNLNNSNLKIYTKLILLYISDILYKTNYIQRYSFSNNFIKLENDIKIESVAISIFTYLTKNRYLRDAKVHPEFNKLGLHKKLFIEAIKYTLRGVKDFKSLLNNNNILKSLSYFTVELDHINSGVQIMGLLLNDDTLQKITTAFFDKENNKIVKEKLYSILNRKISEIITTSYTNSKIIISSNKNFSPIFNLIIVKNLSDKSIKKFLMGYVYGRTKNFDIIKYIIDIDFQYDKIYSNFSPITKQKFKNYLDFIILYAIEQNFPKIKVYQNLMYSIATKHFNNSNNSITWSFRPDIYTIEQNYKVSVRKQSQFRTHRISYKYLDKPWIDKNIRALAPNFIHSIDSFMLYNIVKESENKFLNNYKVIAIHDAFIIPFSEIVNFNNIVKDCYKKYIELCLQELLRLAKKSNVDTRIIDDAIISNKNNSYFIKNIDNISMLDL